MKKNRGYKHNFSLAFPEVAFDWQSRKRKAATMVAVINHFLKKDLRPLAVLDIGSSAGIIANYLSKHFGRVVGMDIDEDGIEFARDNFDKDNLEFVLGDAMNMHFSRNMFDIAICAHVYEHVPDANRLMLEIHRVLKPGGVCYFAGGNRLNIIEPHYNLPFLSVVPRRVAHIYVRVAGKSKYYHEKHLTYWGLKRIVRDFERIDYTERVIANPQFFHADYMIRHGTTKARLAKFITRYAIWLCPSYIWLLTKKHCPPSL